MWGTRAPWLVGWRRRCLEFLEVSRYGRLIDGLSVLCLEPFREFSLQIPLCKYFVHVECGGVRSGGSIGWGRKSKGTDSFKQVRMGRSNFYLPV